MKVIDPEVKLINQVDVNYNLDKDSSPEDISKIQNELFQDILDHIECCNNICYDNDLKESIKDGNNLRVLEHGTVYLTVPVGKPDPNNTEDYMRRMRIVNFYQNDPESIVKGYRSDEENVLYVYFITTNYKVIVENDRHTDLIFLFNNSQYHHQRLTYSLKTNRNVANKLLKIKYLSVDISDPIIENDEIVLVSHLFDNNPVAKNTWIDICKESYKLYQALLDSGLSKEAASKVLPDTVQVNVALTGFKEDFEKLFDSIKSSDDTDYCDIIHMITYDTDNKEIDEELANEMVEENQEEQTVVEEGTTTEGNIDIPE